MQMTKSKISFLQFINEITVFVFCTKAGNNHFTSGNVVFQTGEYLNIPSRLLRESI